MDTSIEPGTVGERYRSSRTRLHAVLSTLDDPSWDLDVAACPGWRVRDVLAHLAGVVEDALAGRITGPPSPEQTAAQVARHRGDDPRLLLEQWMATAPDLEDALTALGLWPAFFDALSHEHDIRGALGDGSFRDHDDVLVVAGFLAGSLPEDIAVDLDGRGGTHSSAPDPATLRTTPFELFRLRFGRRSLAQVMATDWSREPPPAVTGLFIFGPAEQDLHE